jgi:hypothetical protein
MTDPRLTQKLKELLNRPLPGGRGFQQQRDREIRELCRQVAESD